MADITSMTTTGGTTVNLKDASAERSSNKITTITSASTDEQYPSAAAVYALSQTKQDALDSTQMNAVNSGADASNISQIGINTGAIATNVTAINAINGKIPAAASASNQLADKQFVTDNITQSTAIFRGSFATKAALDAVAWQTTNPDAANYVSNNDYAYVEDDETQNDECWRYLYVAGTGTGTGWQPQVRINESPLSAEQIAALNSGATSTNIASIATKQSQIRQASVSLSATWTGTASPYTQTVTVSGSTSTSKIDLQPTAAQIASLITDKVQGLYIENNAGTLTAYSVGSKPSAAMTMQCTVTEVTA